jgi:hypothetical protein
MEGSRQQCRLIINPVIHGKVSVRFSSAEALDVALPAADFPPSACPSALPFLPASIPGSPEAGWHAAVTAH